MARASQRCLAVCVTLANVTLLVAVAADQNCEFAGAADACGRGRPQDLHALEDEARRLEELEIRVLHLEQQHEPDRPQDLHSLEDEARQTLAAGYRLLELYGHGDLAAGFFTCRSPANASIMYVGEQGLHFGEVRAADILAVDIHTKKPVGMPSGIRKRISYGALQMATAVYRRHPSVNAFLHSHPKGSSALSTLAEPNLLMTSEPSFMFYERVAYRDADFFFEDAYAEEVAQSFDAGVFVLHVRNHAIFAAGKDVPQAFFRAYMFEQAATLQLQALATGRALRIADDAESREHRRSCEEWEGGFDGSLEWPGLLRKLERTDAEYKQLE